MSDPNATTPSDAEVREARATLRQHKRAQMQADRQTVQPAVDLTASPEFTALAEQLNGIDRALFANRQIGPHLYAIQAGVDALVAYSQRLDQTYDDAEAELAAEKVADAKPDEAAPITGNPETEA